MTSTVVIEREAVKEARERQARQRPAKPASAAPRQPSILRGRAGLRPGTVPENNLGDLDQYRLMIRRLRFMVDPDSTDSRHEVRRHEDKVTMELGLAGPLLLV